VRSAISNLPPEQQKVLNLAYFLGMSHSQIAEQLREPLGTVKTRIRLAMQKLREALQDDVLTAR
jgi:RNA polymerase sigma-70 factor (ECF subfamily)